MINREKRILILKHVIYTSLLLLLYLLQTVPGLFVLFGSKPIWVIPAAISIAMMEGEMTGGIYGAAAGLLCDISSTTLFGFNGFFVTLFCILSGLLVIHLMHCNVWGCLLYVAVTLLFCRSVEYLFVFGMWGYENVWKIYVFDVLPIVGYSVLITPLPYFAVQRIHQRINGLLQD